MCSLVYLTKGLKIIHIEVKFLGPNAYILSILLDDTKVYSSTMSKHFHCSTSSSNI